MAGILSGAVHAVLQQAQEHARPQLELSHKLGFAAGLAAAILCL